MDIGILVWNTCNAECSHCAVSSGPTQRGEMSLDELKRIVSEASSSGPGAKIGLSGGEAFLRLPALLELVTFATERGCVVSVNTNGFWGSTDEKAESVCRALKEAGLRRLVVSVDDFHQVYIPVERPLKVIAACKSEHLEVELQFVATRGSGRLADFLKEHGDELLNVRCREIPCHPVGRALQTQTSSDLFLRPGVPSGLCPSSILSVAADRRVIPCCNTAGHLPALQVGTLNDDLKKLDEKFRSDPCLNVLRRFGPRALVDTASRLGFELSPDGYIDQCHLCHDLFSDNTRGAKLRQESAHTWETLALDELEREYMKRATEI